LPAAPPAPVAPAEEELPTDVVYALMRTMVAAALADGSLEGRERELIVQRLGESGLSPEQVQQIHRDLVIPATPDDLAALAPDPERRVAMFRCAAVIVLADQQVGEHERAWLARLAAAFNFSEERRVELETELFPGAGGPDASS
jgi:uncharacterized membrane protein YebE (DUF533 family)